MSKPAKSAKGVLPELPKLPSGGLGLPGVGPLPNLAALPTLEKPKTLEELQRLATNPLDANLDLYSESPEQNLFLDECVIEDEFAAIHAARKQQAEAVELANETEFWFAAYFQTRQQCEEFCQALGLTTDKFVDGLELAAKCGISVTPRSAPYKVGRLDKKLADLT